MSGEGKISPRFLKRLLSALLLGPIALGLMVASKPTFLLVIIPAFLLAVYEWIGLVRGAKTGKPLTALIGAIYITAAFYAMYALRVGAEDGWQDVLFLMVTVWISDTGAYVVGKRIGGPKLIPAVSPNKTWAGLLGAIVAPGIFMLLVLKYTAGLDGSSWFYIMYIFGFGMVLGLICQMGDLFISVFKRRAGLKDTGNLIPGHGGILDRIDSLMLASIFAFLVLGNLR